MIRALSVLPAPVVLSGPISAMVQAQDADRDNLSFRYRWFANGKLIAERPTELVEPGLFKRGDALVVEAVPFDGKTEGAAFKSEVVVVGNTPPVVQQVLIEPDEQSFAQRVVARAEISDPDGDSLAVIYRWRKNGEVVKEGAGNDLDIRGFSAKDSIQVDVMASDGVIETKPVISPLFVMNNTAPQFTSSPVSAASEGMYEYHVTAKDPDDDPVTYVLEMAPAGMTIDSQSGILRWNPASGASGSHRVRILAKDTKGGFAAQDFDLALTTPSKS